HKLLVHHCNVLRLRRILYPETTPSHDARTHGIEILGIGLDERSDCVVFRLALDPHAPPVVVVFHRSEAADSYLLHSWNGMEPFFNRAVELTNLGLRISSRLRIDMDDIPVDR